MNQQYDNYILRLLIQYYMLNLLKRHIKLRSLHQNTVFNTQKLGCLTHHLKFYFANDSKQPQNKESNQTNQDDSNQNKNNQKSNKGGFPNLFTTALLSALAGFGAFYIYQQKINRKKISKREAIQNPFQNRPPPKSQVEIGGPWTLTDFNSQKFGSQDLKGSNYLIYFGFAKCPDICPTTLMYLTSVLNHLRNLPGYKDIKLKLVFVSLDPQRDSPEVLKKWLSKFDKQIIGVVGQSPVDKNLQKIKKDFKIYANKVYTPQDNDAQEQSGYKIDHTALVYLMNQKNEFIDLVNLVSNQKQEAQRLLNKMKGQKTNKK